MYLLKPVNPFSISLFAFYLHSTMYLLKLYFLNNTKHCSSLFTFHHVSIKTYTGFRQIARLKYLHSTMYLLKRGIPEKYGGISIFTFHHVSIKTRMYRKRSQRERNLHSTMYLLKRENAEHY